MTTCNSSRVLSCLNVWCWIDWERKRCQQQNVYLWWFFFSMVGSYILLLSMILYGRISESILSVFLCDSVKTTKTNISLVKIVLWPFHTCIMHSSHSHCFHLFLSILLLCLLLPANLSLKFISFCDLLSLIWVVSVTDHGFGSICGSLVAH